MFRSLEEAARWLEKNNAMNIAAGIKDVDWNSMMDRAVDFAKSGLGDVLNSTTGGRCGWQVVNFYRAGICHFISFPAKEKLRSQAENPCLCKRSTIIDRNICWDCG